jgi:hypothetical protein
MSLKPKKKMTYISKTKRKKIPLVILVKEISKLLEKRSFPYFLRQTALL